MLPFWYKVVTTHSVGREVVGYSLESLERVQIKFSKKLSNVTVANFTSSVCKISVFKLIFLYPVKQISRYFWTRELVRLCGLFRVNCFLILLQTNFPTGSNQGQTKYCATITLHLQFFLLLPAAAAEVAALNRTSGHSITVKCSKHTLLSTPTWKPTTVRAYECFPHHDLFIYLWRAHFYYYYYYYCCYLLASHSK